MGDPRGEDLTRPSLLLRLRDASDAGAWQVFMETYAPLVYAYCRKCGLQDADAADVAQDILMQVARTMPSFTYDSDRGRFRDWLRTVARHKVMRFLGKRQRAAETPGNQDELDTLRANRADAEWGEAFHDQVLRAAMARIRGLFEPATWDVFERVWLEHRPAIEVSQALGLPIDVVYSAKSRILKRLRDEVLMLAEDMPQFVPLDG